VTNHRDEPQDPLEAEPAPAALLDPWLAAITHELRTPLQAILGLCRQLEAESRAPHPPPQIAQIATASTGMLRVVNDLLDLARLESGTLDIDHNQPLQIRALVLSTLSVAEGLRQHKAVRLYASVAPECPEELMGDAGRLAQILTNLTANAVRFTDQGLIDIHVRVLRRTAGDVSLRVSVSDTGIGLPLETIEQISAPLDRDTALVPPRRGGAGFGLSVVRRLLELHASELRVASVQGGGTIMWFDLTLGVAPPSMPARQPPPVRPRVALWCEDERLRATLRTLWQAHGDDLLAAADVDGADLLLVDVHASPPPPACAATAPEWLPISALPGIGDGAPESVTRLASRFFPPPAAAPLQVEPTLLGMKILVVDDNVLNQQVIEDDLRRLGVQCVLAGTGRDALKLLRDALWDAVILDVNLPDMSGFDIAAFVREHIHCAGTPLITVSADMRTDDEWRGRQLGIQARLLKPHCPQQLRQTLLNLRRHHDRAIVSVDAEQPTGTPDLRRLLAREWPALRAAITGAHDPLALRQAVHAARGAIAVCRLPELLAQARELEELLLAGQPPSHDHLLEFIQAVDQITNP